MVIPEQTLNSGGALREDDSQLNKRQFYIR